MARANERSWRSPTLIDAPLTQHLAVAAWQPTDDPIRPDPRRRHRDVLLGDWIRQPNVAQHIPGKQKDVLLDVADERAELGDRNVANVRAVDEDSPALGIIETKQQIDDGGLAGTSVANQRERSA
jgi:hypothetical protein